MIRIKLELLLVSKFAILQLQSSHSIETVYGMYGVWSGHLKQLETCDLLTYQEYLTCGIGTDSLISEVDQVDQRLER